MYFLGAYLAKDLKFIEVIIVSLFALIVAFLSESAISSTSVNWLATIPECGAFVLGYIVYHVLR
jgi:hypothetical protein